MKRYLPSLFTIKYKHRYLVGIEQSVKDIH